MLPASLLRRLPPDTPVLFWQIILPLATLILVILVGRWIQRASAKRVSRADYDFQIEELFRLLQASEITPEEFERAKASVLARRGDQPQDPMKRGFEVQPPRKPMIQSLEDRIAP